MKKWLKHLAVGGLVAFGLASIAAGLQSVWDALFGYLPPLHFSWSALWSVWVAWMAFSLVWRATPGRSGAAFPRVHRLFGPSLPVLLIATGVAQALTALYEVGVFADGLWLSRSLNGATFVLLLYFIPSFVARWRLHRKLAAIVALNGLLGFTFVGWVAALVWALAEDNRDAVADTSTAAVAPVTLTMTELAIRETAARRGADAGSGIPRGVMGGIKR